MVAARDYNMESLAIEAVSAGFGAIASGFIVDAICRMIPWLLVTVAVILCDLAAGIRKSFLMGEEVRISRAVRLTMGKMVTYFSFVVMVCMVNIAAGGEHKIDEYSCLVVCGIEGCSIITNILKPKGVSINWGKLFGILGKKFFGMDDAEELKDVIEKDKEKS